MSEPGFVERDDLAELAAAPPPELEAFYDWLSEVFLPSTDPEDVAREAFCAGWSARAEGAA